MERKTAKDVADWMFKELKKDTYLDQDYAVHKIPELFGGGFTYEHKENGSLCIAETVKIHFRKLYKGDKEGHGEWRNNDKCWEWIND